MPPFELYQGDALGILALMQSESVQCVITSPPYWGLRDYKVAEQIGLEETPEEYVAVLVAVFREVRRVLRKDGTLWLNMGDSYARSPARGVKFQAGDSTYLTNVQANEGNRGPSVPPGLKEKDLVGIPWRVAFALQADGWWLRSDIIWSKPNPMPESVTDRPTKAHEYLFLLSKQARYFYDAEAIAEPGVTGDLRKPYAPGQVDARGNGHDRGGGMPRTAGKHSKMSKQSSGYRIVENVARAREEGADHDNPFGATRNKRSVWEIATVPFPGAHFAAFPEELVRPCVLAGSKPGDVILDPFCGAGTVGIVALHHERRFIGIELSGAYIDMARTRIVGKEPLFRTEGGHHVSNHR
jgi:DNA modification methylase